MSKTLILMPAHNEEATIGNIINGIREQGFKDILVVDDCSTDNTSDVAKSYGIKVISLPYNMGAWKATQTGFRYAIKNNFDLIVTMDSDGQHIPDQIHKLLEAQKSGYEVVIGNCVQRGSNLRLFAWKIFKYVSRIRINDLTSGFRVYNHRAVTILSGRKATMLNYQDLGVLFLIKHYGLSYSEIPVQMVDRRIGISRIFNSWWAVFVYMLYTLILIMTKSIPFFGNAYKIKLIKESKLD